MKKIALIVGGGKGSRMGSDIPKQFLLLDGKPVLMRTLEKFYTIADELVLVLPASQFEFWKELCTAHGFTQPHKLVPGGETRSASVQNGLYAVEGDALIAIHDAVRPLVSEKLIGSLYEAALVNGSAIPVIPVRETLRKKAGETTLTVDREEFMIVQTPQCFLLSDIKNAYAIAEGASFSDDASVYENSGKVNFTVPGETQNIKITFTEDLAIAEAIVKQLRSLR